MSRRIKSSQNVQPQVDLPSTELPFFLFESLLNLFTNAEFTNTHGEVTGKKWPFTQGKNSPSQRYALLGCGQVCRIWPLVGSRRSFYTRADSSVGSSVVHIHACSCRQCLMTVLSRSCQLLLYPLWYLPGLVCHVLFWSRQKAFESGCCLFWNVLKGVNLSRYTSHFTACSLAPANRGRQSTVHPGSARVVDFVDDLLYKAF